MDATDDGTAGLLRINLYGDATTPGSGNLLNGDFEDDLEVLGMRSLLKLESAEGFEHRDGMVETVNVIVTGCMGMCYRTKHNEAGRYVFNWAR